MTLNPYNKSKKICIYSYNSRGFNEEKQNVCKTLMINSERYIPILCNQENFLLNGNRFKVKQCFPNARIIFKAAIQDSKEGRPKNGMFIAIPDEIKDYAKDVSPNHWRVQAVIIKSNILLINTYFPTDPKVNDFDTDELLTTLTAIRATIESNEFQNIIWVGDINADFLRQTKFTKIVHQFIEDKSLVKSWDSFSIDFTHIYELNGTSYTSTIDHIFWNKNLTNNVIEADVLHLPDNSSDHCPVYCIVNIDNLHKTVESIPKDTAPKPCWKIATTEQKEVFKSKLEERLANIPFPLNVTACHNTHCVDITHNNNCDDVLLSFLETIKLTADECIPISGNGSYIKKKSIPRWNNEIKPFKDNAYFWHSVWQSAGRPLNNELHRIMKRTRNVYHYQIRKNRKMTEIIKKNSLLNACINNNGDIFKEIRKLRKVTPTIPSTIDGVNSNIQDHFSAIYRRLYNSVDDKENLKPIIEEINRKIDHSSLIDVLKVTPELVTEAINHLKPDKHDPIIRFSSDCLKYNSKIIGEYLAKIFRHQLIHGHITSNLMMSTIIPIVKDKLGEICSSNNYRSIAISSLILKVFDWVIIILNRDQMKTDELQFGF